MDTALLDACIVKRTRASFRCNCWSIVAGLSTSLLRWIQLAIYHRSSTTAVQNIPAGQSKYNVFDIKSTCRHNAISIRQSFCASLLSPPSPPLPRMHPYPFRKSSICFISHISHLQSTLTIFYCSIHELFSYNKFIVAFEPHNNCGIGFPSCALQISTFLT